VPEQDLRNEALSSLNRKRSFDVAFSGFVVALVALVAIWALTGGGYFWPGWPMLAGMLGFAAAGIAFAASNRSFNEAQVRYEMARLEGVPPPGIQR
jgi:hypothetical protein